MTDSRAYEAVEQVHMIARFGILRMPQIAHTIGVLTQELFIDFGRYLDLMNDDVNCAPLGYRDIVLAYAYFVFNIRGSDQHNFAISVPIIDR